MIARGNLRAKGVCTPEQVIAGPLLDRLLEDLSAVDVRFEETTELHPGFSCVRAL